MTTPTTTRRLTMERGAPVAVQPPSKGRLLSPKQVIAQFFADLDPAPTARWVRDTVPNKIQLSHSRVVWYEADVAAWIEARRAA